MPYMMHSSTVEIRCAANTLSMVNSESVCMLRESIGRQTWTIMCSYSRYICHDLCHFIRRPVVAVSRPIWMKTFDREPNSEARSLDRSMSSSCSLIAKFTTLTKGDAVYQSSKVLSS